MWILFTTDWNITFARWEYKKRRIRRVDVQNATRIIGSLSNFHVKVNLGFFRRFGCDSHHCPYGSFRVPLPTFFVCLSIGRLRIYFRARTAEFAPCFYRAAAAASRRVSSGRTHLQFWHIWRWGITQCTLFAGESALLETERRTKGREHPTSYVAGTLEYQMILGKRIPWSISRRLFVFDPILSVVVDVVSRSSWSPWIFSASWRKAGRDVSHHSPSTLPLPLFPSS